MRRGVTNVSRFRETHERQHMRPERVTAPEMAPAVEATLGVGRSETAAIALAPDAGRLNESTGDNGTAERTAQARSCRRAALSAATDP